MKRGLVFGLLFLGMTFRAVLLAQCSSLYTTPEFPIATHPADGHTQSWGANTFLQAQMGGAASFTGLQIYVDNSFGPTTYASQQIWLRHTGTSTYVNANYPTTTGFTQCFNGTYNFPMSGLYTIAFNVSPFSYNGGSNVEILFENRSNVYRANEPWFRRTPTYGAAVYRSKWNGNFGAGGFPGSVSNGSAVRLTYTLSLTFAGGGGCGAILPVSFPEFSAMPEGKAVHCTWEIAEALGNEVVLERSNGDANFVAMETQVAGMAGNFDWTDTQPNAGTNIYRLRSTDTDGTALLSSMILVDMGYVNQLKMYCSAVDDGIDILLDSPDARLGTLEVSDLQGRIVFSESLTLEPGRNHVHVPQTGATGMWIIQARAGTDATVQRVIR